MDAKESAQDEIIRTKKEVVVSNDGPNVARMHKRYPELVKHPDIKHTFEVYNPGKSEATIVIPGLGQEDVDRFKRGKMFAQITEELDDTVVLFNWPPYTHIPEYTAAQLEDLCLEEGIESVKLLGASYGGHVSLALISDIKTNNVPIEIAGLVTVVSPVDAGDLQVPSRLAKKAAPVLLPLLMSRVLLARGNVERKLKYAQKRSEIARVSAFRDTPFTKDDFISSIPVLAITTQGEPLLGGKMGGPPTPDLLVRNQQAAQKLKGLFDDVEVMQVRGGSLTGNKEGFASSGANVLGAHMIVKEDVPKVHERIMSFLRSID